MKWTEFINTQKWNKNITKKDGNLVCISSMLDYKPIWPFLLLFAHLKTELVSIIDPKVCCKIKTVQICRKLV